LETWVRGRNRPYRQVVRTKIITMAADGVSNQDIAKILGVSRPMVQLWRERFLALRLAGLKQDAPRPRRMGESMRQLVREQYTLDPMVTRFFDLYEELPYSHRA
jgi:transposase